MSRHPWRHNTSEDIASQRPSQWETPAGAQEKADQAEQNAKDYTDSHSEAGAEVNQNAYSSVNGIAAISKTDSIELEAGTGIIVTPVPAEKKVRITAGGTSIPGLHGSEHVGHGADPIPVATISDSGLMSAADKQELGLHTAQLADETTIGKYVTGFEYLFHYHEKLRTKQDVGVVFSGDSTTDDGPWVTDKNYLIHNIARSMLIKRGVRNATCINAGHSNMSAIQWESTYLSEDLLLNPDLYIWRWGLNDGAYTPKTDRLQVFTDALRNGLTTLRAQYNANQMSVVLMMPNSTNDPTHGRDSEWFDLIYPVIFQAARDFQCCFVDTYHYLLDSTNITWQDEPMGIPGVHIHPLNTGVAWIASLLEDILVPPALREFGMYAPLSTDKLCDVNEAPSTFPDATSIYRTTGAWPFDGIVTTNKAADGVLLQINSSLYAQDSRSFAFRLGVSVFGVPGSIGDDSWGEWTYNERKQPLTLENGFSPTINYAAPFYCTTLSNKVEVDGVVDMPAGLSTGTIVAWLPSGRRPSESIIRTVATEGGNATLAIWSDGSIRVLKFEGTGWMSLGFSFKL